MSCGARLPEPSEPAPEPPAAHAEPATETPEPRPASRRPLEAVAVVIALVLAVLVAWMGHIATSNPPAPERAVEIPRYPSIPTRTTPEPTSPPTTLAPVLPVVTTTTRPPNPATTRAATTTSPATNPPPTTPPPTQSTPRGRAVSATASPLCRAGGWALNVTVTLSGFTTDHAIVHTYEGFVPGIGNGVWVGSDIFGGPSVLSGLAPETGYGPLPSSRASVDWYVWILKGDAVITSPTYTTNRPGCAG